MSQTKYLRFNGFSTASGRKVNVSDKALEAARKKLESDAKEQDVQTKYLRSMDLVRRLEENTATEMKANVSDKAVDAAQKKLESNFKGGNYQGKNGVVRVSKDSNGPDDFTIELSESRIPMVVKETKKSWSNRGSFIFKAKTSSPSGKELILIKVFVVNRSNHFVRVFLEFHSDREAKFTIPLLPKAIAM
eukprot:gene595-10287_t